MSPESTPDSVSVIFAEVLVSEIKVSKPTTFLQDYLYFCDHKYC
jgi:hypothetical protein